MKKFTFFKSLAYGLRFNLKHFPFCFIGAHIIGGVFSGVLSGLSVLVHQRFFDSVEDVISGTGLIGQAYFAVAILAAFILTQQIMGIVTNMINTYMEGRSTGEQAKRIHEKIIRLNPICFEDTSLHDDITKAQEGSGAVLQIVNTVTGIIAFFIPYFLVMGAYFAYLQPRLMWVFALTFFPVLISQTVRSKMYANFTNKIAPIQRQYDYLYERAMTGKEYFKETRILGGYNFLYKRFRDVVALRAHEELKVDKKNALLMGITGSFSLLGYLGILAMLVHALLIGDISVGAFAAVFGAVGMLFGLMENIVNDRVGAMMRNLGTAGHFIHFMDLPERADSPGTPDYNAGIVAENIRFSYPHTEKTVLDGVSLTISAGETVAIVGENGAGKTTLVRIFLVLYLPDEGSVQLHGLDTAKHGFAALYNGVSGVFQNFQKYAMTLDENVRMSDLTRNASTEEVLTQASINLDEETFPAGAKTMLAREFDGVDLSGGQWQRVALARGLYRVHNLVVLDEPTAAIDPLEESKIYRLFTEISKDKTAIIITHRLGSTKMADRVLVMDSGKIVATGTHESLMAEGGLYATMFAAQADWYRE